MRWSIVAVVPVVLDLGLACAHPPASSTPAAGASAPDGSSLRAATLEYSGTHRGDHPDWRYRQTVTIAAAERAGRPVWRRTSTFGADAPMHGAGRSLRRARPLRGRSPARARIRVVRMEYVVNPATIGDEKRSVGVDELVRFAIQPQAAAARP